ncbi:F-box/kelch-repeat protein [Quillaja saponaria]|uniref:F-box/kelch-repeat protein n=1 Tax=Quillaja saponaria TaxID=32244 RepID=A0AAD7PYB1_QUISA|nr:F-box/kelch-repeat protein [Quillaja saponaria]
MSTAHLKMLEKNMSEITEFVPGIPEELGLECLIRLHYSTHQVAVGVCHRWRELLQSRNFYFHRKQSGHTHKAACFVQALQVESCSDEFKPVGGQAYGVSVFDPVSGIWDWIDPVPKYPNGIPLFCQITSSEGKLVLMGGWDPASYNPVKDVFVYDFTTRKWNQGKEMPDTRSFFAAVEFGGRVLVAGGHDESKNALKSTWAYDLRNNEWTELTPMSEDRDECEGVLIGSEFWVVSGYRTEKQGQFETSAESYNLETGRWRRVEDVWKGTQGPRSCIGVGPDGKLFSWTECDSAVRVGTSVVELSGMTIVSGSAYQGEPQSLYIIRGLNGKLDKIEVPDGFKGFVQSGCYVEI